MARKPMVTRTLTSTVATVMCVDTVNAEIFNEDVIVARTYSDEKKLLKAVKDVAETEEKKVVQVVKSEVIEELYGMTETEFMQYAKKLPPRKAELEEAEADEQ